MSRKKRTAPGGNLQGDTKGRQVDFSPENREASSVYHKEGERLYTHTPQGVKLAGFIVSDSERLCFVKPAVERKHFHRVFNAWGLSCEVLRKLHLRHISRIRIECLDTGMTEETTVTAYDAHGFHSNQGCGEQVFLERKHFRRIDPRQTVLELGV